MKFIYGTPDAHIDVTEICVNECMHNNMITIPAGDDVRAKLFTDPIVGKPKYIFIVFDYGIYYQYDEHYMIMYNTSTNEIATKIYIPLRLFEIHSKVMIKYGSIQEELPEQIMTTNYLTGKEKVLEIGGNIGRNSLVIASLLEDNSQFVSLESNKLNASKLIENRDLNNYKFHVEPSALSKRKLIQLGWTTMASDVLLDGYEMVDTITLEELNAKYNIAFDTLVLDCEGAFYYILLDMPEILDGIRLIIVENDYTDDAHKEYVSTLLKSRGFHIEYNQTGHKPDFYQVWKK